MRKGAMGREAERTGDVEALVEGILREARDEARRGVEEARKRAEGRVEAAGVQAARIAEETEAAAERQVASIAREAESKLAAELARAELAARESAWRELVARALGLCREEARKPDFRKVLVRLAAEAAVGLGGGEARARFAGPLGATLDDGFLRETERLVKVACGLDTGLVAGEPCDDGNPGVVIESIDGRLSYDNRLEARFARLEGELRARALRGLFGDDESGEAGNGRGVSWK
ncbi:MAG: hypothetical protein JXA15_09220 [Spirochaetales bacterium]|nr:hypothetical protein [Spirochaetales bacterium]